jgi:hypothetical protein
MALIDLDIAKKHLRITDSDHDAEIQTKLDQAGAIVTDYLKAQADPTWNEDTTPAVVQSAVLLMLGHLNENRGPDMRADNEVWAAIERLLMRLRDPAVA